jgi:rhomboid protease GluP
LELQNILLAVTGIALAIFAVRLARAPVKLVFDWWIAIAIVAAISVVAWLYMPGSAGLISFGALSALVFLPLRVDREAQRAARAGADQKAIVLSRIAQLVHPLGAIGARPSTLSALAHIRATGELDAQTLERIGAHQDPEVAEWYRVLALHAAADYAGVRAALTIPSRRARMLQNGIGAIFVRAVAMTGTRAEVLEAIEDAERHDLTLDDPERRAILALEACAALGDVQGVRALSPGLADRMPRGSLERALAAAQLEAGERIAARETIERARQSELDPAVRRAIEKLSSDKRATSEPLTDRARAILERLHREADAARALAPLSDGAAFNAWVTWSLAGAICAWFVVIATRGSTTDPVNLARNGGLLLPIEDASGAVGIFTSTFVHFGVVHLVFNLYALVAFGRFVESFYGRVKMILVWILATIASGVGVALFNSGPHILVGASGAIFGLGGALAAAVGLRSDLRRSQRGREELRGFAGLVVLQFIFDRFVPGVSGTAHVCGLLGGLIAGAALLPRRRAQAASGSLSIAAGKGSASAPGGS